MAFANGSGRRLAYVPEASFGVTPATPTFKVTRQTSGGIRTNKTTETSDEIRADRNVVDEFQLAQDVTAELAFELTYGSFDDFFEALFQSTWATNVLKNGALASAKSSTFEETYELGATDSFYRALGMCVNSMSLNATARQAVTGSFGFMGRQEQAGATAIIAGATYAAPNTKKVMTGPMVASLLVGGQSYKVRSVALEMNNNGRVRPVLGSLYSEEFGWGRFDGTGTFEAYFESGALYDLVLSHGGGALTFTIGDVTAEKYTFLLPSIKFGNGERQPGGNNDDVMVSIPFRALFDATEQCSVKLTRAVA